MADKNRNKSKMAERRRRRVRSKIFGTAERPRLTVSKSLRSVSVQIIDDQERKTLIGLSSASKLVREVIGPKDTKTAVAKKVGAKIAELARQRGIEHVVFDRNRYRYHGRVKAAAEGAREGGLKF